MRPLIVLRPEPGATATLAAARAMGLTARSVPLFAVRPIDWAAPDPDAFDALLITSANAFRHGGSELRKLRGLPIHAVGDATAKAARDAGFAIASVGDAGVAALLENIEPDQRLLHLSGVHRTPTPRPVPFIPVYESAAIDAPGEDFGGAVVLVHSARSARRLAELVTDRRDIAVAAISQGVAEAAGGGWGVVAAAEVPEEGALLALAARLCQTKPEDE